MCSSDLLQSEVGRKSAAGHDKVTLIRHRHHRVAGKCVVILDLNMGVGVDAKTVEKGIARLHIYNVFGYKTLAKTRRNISLKHCSAAHVPTAETGEPQEIGADAVTL